MKVIRTRLAAAIVFAIVNVLIAAGTGSAGFDDDVCWDPEKGGTVACCPSCSFSCQCNLPPPPPPPE